MRLAFLVSKWPRRVVLNAYQRLFRLSPTCTNPFGPIQENTGIPQHDSEHASVNFERVAVDDARLPDEVVSQRRAARRKKHQCNNRTRKHHSGFPFLANSASIFSPTSSTVKKSAIICTWKAKCAVVLVTECVIKG
jgi:hypothetical protein